ncbi:glycoside hydrolase/deacetylase [Neocallimastix lanati (nom. inval.)]|uniref:Glycoside hydrolase/deacetylase n=1 Tax=Neocallimastix californiae TaxID=1754190 RepID=A0A1Y2DDK7_9FUNG|nr:glycoside hydrolase/deacetylase [Neocallimastix sp. JGI-2020a]ORY57329.1 glycoside hydrolase/deacetylase [Neocallimastix californiae]|eukprot:ORY57329.1 glycoside hydrolase/deacetylase [Neocallimastix californiae]
MKSIIISGILSLSLVALSRASCGGGYAQCGGKTFSGEKCCISGYECTYINEWYSECKPATTTSASSGSTTSGQKMKYVESIYPKGTGIKPVYQCINPKHWALTMDDGPTQYSDIILDLLKKYNIKATFFVCGNLYMKTSNPEWARIIKRMDDEGHIIGNHTFDHVELPKLATTDEIISQMKQIEDALYATIGKKPAFMRLPCLNGNSNQTVMSTLESLGYNASVNCNADSMDYANGGDKEYAVQALSKQVANNNSVISLNHLLYGGATAENIIAMMTAEIEYMLAQGYKPVTMEECLGIRAYQ